MLRVISLSINLLCCDVTYTPDGVLPFLPVNYIDMMLYFINLYHNFLIILTL